MVKLSAEVFKFFKILDAGYDCVTDPGLIQCAKGVHRLYAIQKNNFCYSSPGGKFATSARSANGERQRASP
jgi:hypothetical protein